MLCFFNPLTESFYVGERNHSGHKLFLQRREGNGLSVLVIKCMYSMISYHCTFIKRLNRHWASAQADHSIRSAHIGAEKDS